MINIFEDHVSAIQCSDLIITMLKDYVTLNQCADYPGLHTCLMTAGLIQVLYADSVYWHKGLHGLKDTVTSVITCW